MAVSQNKVGISSNLASVSLGKRDSGNGFCHFSSRERSPTTLRCFEVDLLEPTTLIRLVFGGTLTHTSLLGDSLFHRFASVDEGSEHRGTFRFTKH